MAEKKRPFDPFAMIQQRPQAEEPVQETPQEVTEPRVSVAVMPEPEIEQPKDESGNGQKRPRIKRERPSAPKPVSQVTPDREAEETQAEKLAVRLTPELLEETKNAAWFAGLDLSEYVRGALRERNKRLIDLNGGKSIPARPERPAPIKDLLGG